MIPLASIEGKVVFMVVAALVGVINWWLEKRKKEAGGDFPQPTAAPRQPASGGQATESEQERLNRFLQALGVPQPPGHAQPQPQAAIRPRDRRPQIAKAIAKPAQKAIRRQAQPALSEPEEMHRAGRIEEAASSIERISGEFSAMNVRVAMPPVQTLERPAHLATANAGTTSVLERLGNPLVTSLRRTLTNPVEIRAAFLAAELLGPPRGLQK